MAGFSCSLVIQAVVSAIQADAACTALIGGRIFDWPGQQSEFPCVTIGDAVEMPWDTDTTFGAEIELTVHTWARGARSRQTARRIGEAISNLLHRNTTLAIAGHQVLSIERGAGTVELEAADAVAHGIYRFTVRTVSE